MKKVTIPADVAAVLTRATTEGNIVRLPEGQLERGLYVAVDKVLKALGGKWNKGAGGHVFASGIGEQLATALADGHVVDVKKTLEQFFTPAGLADRMVTLARIKPGDLVLEPSAGNGALLRAIRAAGAACRAYEIDPALRDGLRAEFFPWLSGSMPAELLRQADAVGGDFMLVDAEPEFDAVVMNPPFSRNQDVRHVRRAFDWLRPGGRLVAIMSEHAAFSQDRESFEFMSWVDDMGASFEPLPDATFRESGTMVSTRLLVAEASPRG